MAPAERVIVVGAGPAGSACAAELARRGREVVLVNAGQARPRRVESLPVHGVRIAGELGLGPALAEGSLGTAAALHMAWRREVERRDFDDDPPLLVERRRLDAALLAHAAGAGATIVAGRARRPMPSPGGVRLAVDGRPLAGAFLVDARGRSGLGPRTALRRGPALAALPFRARAAGAPARPMMLLEAVADGWVWACHAPTGAVTGAVFADPGRLAAAGAAERVCLAADSLARSCLLLGCGCPVTGRPLEATKASAARAVDGGRLIRIGDAALARDPIASHGLVHALRTARHAAAAIDTMLDPSCDPSAALAFLENRHAEAVAAASAATATAYLDQARHRTAFWAERTSLRPDAAAPPAGAVAAHRRGDPRLTLAAPLCRAAVLAGGRIAWSEALRLPASARAAAFLGPVPARRIAEALADRPRAAALVTRLAGVAGAPAAARIVALLRQEGAVVPCPVGR